MNNNQDNPSINPQINNEINQNTNINDYNQPLNVIPNVNNNDLHEFDNAFINRTIENTTTVNKNVEMENNPNSNQIINTFNTGFATEQNEISQSDEEITIGKQNKFINNNIDTTSTSLNNLNIDGTYNNMPKIDYSQDPKVQENLNKKNTVTITSEGKIFIIIVIVLLLFIFALPTIFDMIRNINYS